MGILVRWILRYARVMFLLITLRYKSTLLYNKQYQVHDCDNRMENICIDELADKRDNTHSTERVCLA